MNREEKSPIMSESVEASPSVFSDRDDDEEEAATPTIMPTRRRGGVSSESQDTETKESTVTMTIYAPKSPETKKQLEAAVKRNVLFSGLEPDDREQVFGAMEKINAKTGETIIRQGDEGDYFYILDTGAAEVWRNYEETGDKMVKLLKPLDSFGELALIYNCPRAATVKTSEPTVLWRIDRVTYRNVIMGAQIRKRELYDSFLKRVPILEPLQKWERSVVADALLPVSFAQNQVIITQGAPGDSFYMIVEGEVRVTKKGADGKDIELSTLGQSTYFGEISLLTDRPRAATVTATKPTKCVQLDSDRFKRLLGPCEDILRRNIPLYNQYQSLLV